MQVVVGMLAFFIWLCLFITYKMRKADRERTASIENFIETEREANETRRKDIDPSLFYTPDLSALPIRGDNSKQEEKVLKLSERTMIRFPGRVTNIELKKAYGPMQLEIITQYEESFNSYLSALIELAEFRIENGLENEALRILEHTLSLGSEYKKSYSLTADLYAMAHNSEGLEGLLEMAEGRIFTDEGIKRWVLNMIRKKTEISV